MTPPTFTAPRLVASPTIEELLRSFEDYANTLLAFQQAHPASDDGQSPFAVIGDELALMTTRREVLTRLKRNLDAFRSRTADREEEVSRRLQTPEPTAGPSTSGNLPTPPSGCADSEPAATMRSTGSLIGSVQISPSVRLHAPTPGSSPFRPLKREDAFYGPEMLKRHDFARGRNGRTSFNGKDIRASPVPDSCDPQKPSVVAVSVNAPALSTTTAVDALSDPPNSETTVVTRVTRSSARKIGTEASGSGRTPSSSRTTHGKRKRLNDDVDAGGKVNGGANLPPAKRRKRLSSKSGSSSK